MANTGPSRVPPSHQKKPVKVGLWTAVWLTVAVGTAVALSAFNDSKGNPLYDSGVLSQALATVGIVAAALGPSLIQNRRDTAVIKHEVKNDHPKNMRVEQDDRYRSSYQQGMTIIEQNKRILDYVERLGRDVRSVDKKIDIKTDRLRDEFQAVQHENVTRFNRSESAIKSLERGLLSWLRGDPMPLKRDPGPTEEDDDNDRI